MKIQNFITTTLLLNRNSIICIEPHNGFPPIIAFSGTQNVKDLLNYDFNVLPSNWPDENSLVHSGFAKRTEKLMKRADKFIEKHDNFILGGHSLGGSCAILCASKMILDGKNVDKVYTFGCPGVGLDSFRTQYSFQNLNEKTFNYVTPNDFVVNLPIIYKHVGNEILLDSFTKNPIINHDLAVYDNYLFIYDYCLATY
jgi:predicted lipase